jgi:Uma2 family endonuclease
MATAETEIYYPESDGKPLGETEYHIDATIYLYQTLKHRYRRKPVYVASDMFLYYEEGNPRAVKAPDVMAFKNISKQRRRIFKTWVEKAFPCVIIELVSVNSVAEDLGEKKVLYARLGVREYYVFDPEGTCLDTPLQGFRLRGKKYVPIAAEPDGSLVCQELELRLQAEGDLLRLLEGKSGRRLLSPLERMVSDRQRLLRARQRAEQAQQRAEQAQQRAEQAQQRAEQAQQRAEQERQAREQEQQRAEALAAEVERLRSELEKGKRRAH